MSELLAAAFKKIHTGMLDVSGARFEEGGSLVKFLWGFYWRFLAGLVLAYGAHLLWRVGLINPDIMEHNGDERHRNNTKKERQHDRSNQEKARSRQALHAN